MGVFCTMRKKSAFAKLAAIMICAREFRGTFDNEKA